MRADVVWRRRILIATFLREEGGRSHGMEELRRSERQRKEGDRGRRARKRA